MGASQIFCVVTLFVYFIGAACMIISLASPYWILHERKDDINHREEYFGLWKICAQEHQSGNLQCNSMDIGAQEDYFKATVALMIIAFLGCVVGGCIYVIASISAILQMVSGGFAIIAISVFAGELDRDGYSHSDLSWGYGFAVVSGILLLLNGALLGIICLKNGCSLKTTVPCRFELDS